MALVAACLPGPLSLPHPTHLLPFAVPLWGPWCGWLWGGFSRGLAPLGKPLLFQVAVLPGGNEQTPQASHPGLTALGLGETPGAWESLRDSRHFEGSRQTPERIGVARRRPRACGRNVHMTTRPGLRVLGDGGQGRCRASRGPKWDIPIRHRLALALRQLGRSLSGRAGPKAPRGLRPPTDEAGACGRS